MHSLRAYLLCLVACAAMLCAGCSEESRAFQKLQRVRRDQATARPLAEHLMQTDAGLQLAFDDFDCFGGTTRGWSNWMLEHASNTNVNARLNALCANSSAAMSKRTSAAWILWRKTSEDQYLHELFNLVREPGPKAVEMGRNWLASTSQDKQIWTQLRVDSTRAVSMTTNAFAQALATGKIGLRSWDTSTSE